MNRQRGAPRGLMSDASLEKRIWLGSLMSLIRASRWLSHDGFYPLDLLAEENYVVSDQAPDTCSADSAKFLFMKYFKYADVSSVDDPRLTAR